MLNIFRRHLDRCDYPREDRSYRRCHCPIHVEGKLGNDFIRKALGTTNWELAQRQVSEAEARGVWEAPEQAQLVTVADAVLEFDRDAEKNRRLNNSTLKKYKLMLKQLKAFADSKGIRYLKEFDTATLRQFQQTWSKIGPRTALKKLERVKAFFSFAQESRWVPENPAKPLKGPERIKPTQKLPFEPEELEKIVEACRTIDLQVGTNEDLLAFVLLLRYSGLRIGDAAMLTTERFKGDDLFVYTQKSGTHVYVPLPPYVMELVKRIRPRHGKYLFVGPESLRMETASDLWRRKLTRVFTAAGIEHGNPHRFRHTFAVELLKNGVPVEDVSILLGHSSVRITEEHYSAWTKARQDILKSHVEKTWRTFGVIEGGRKSA
jgi:integrase/recombinase XerD